MRLKIRALHGRNDVVQVRFHVWGTCEFTGTFLLAKLVDWNFLDVLVVHDFVALAVAFQYSL